MPRNGSRDFTSPDLQTLGGGGKIVREQASGDLPHPRRAVDLAIAQTAYGKLRRIVVAKNIDNNAEGRSYQYTRDMYDLARTMCRFLARVPHAVLTPKQRAALCKVIGAD